MDPYNEFFIQINPYCNKIESYWTSGFILKKSKIPKFFDL